MIRQTLKTWIPIAAASTAVLLGAFSVGQQVMRQSANFVPQQIAEDAAYQLENGAVPASIMPLDRSVVDVSHSVAPFVMVFDEQDKALESSMKMGSTLPTPPSGVFAYVRNYGEERILTWEPGNGVRLATTIIHWKSSVPATGGAIASGFVLGGQGLRQVEDTTQRLFYMMLAGWLATMVGTLVVTFLSIWIFRDRE